LRLFKGFDGDAIGALQVVSYPNLGFGIMAIANEAAPNPRAATLPIPAIAQMQTALYEPPVWFALRGQAQPSSGCF
jgi:hypothetical protein